MKTLIHLMMVVALAALPALAIADDEGTTETEGKMAIGGWYGTVEDSADMAAEYAHGNAMSLKRLQQDPNVELRPFPDEVLALLQSLTREVLEELMASDPASAKIGTMTGEMSGKASTGMVRYS